MAGDLELHVEIPAKAHTHTVILLHGRDSTAAEFASEIFECQAPDGRYVKDIFPGARWVFPSPRRRWSARFGAELSQWFDIWSVEHPHKRSELQIDGLRESIADIRELVSEEARLVGSADRLVLGGLSQGCATAVHVLLCAGQRLGAFVGLCGWLPFENELKAASGITRSIGIFSTGASASPGPAPVYSGSVEPARQSAEGVTGASRTKQVGDDPAMQTPVFIGHAKDDPVVSSRYGEALAKCLEAIGMVVTWKAYDDGGHWINEPQGEYDLILFLMDVLDGIGRHDGS